MGHHRRQSRELVAPFAERARKALSSVCARSVVCGSLRRGDPMVGDIDIVVSGVTGGLEAVERALSEEFRILEIERMPARVRTAFTVEAPGTLEGRLDIDVWWVTDRTWGAALLHATGPGLFNTAVRRISMEKGWDFNANGVTRNRRLLLPCASEREAFESLGLPWIDPRDRERFLWEELT